MKKLLLVALMAVGASAWADVDVETYSMTITVEGFTHENVHELPSDTIMRLVDNNGKVWMELGVGDLSEGVWDAGIGKLVGTSKVIPSNGMMQGSTSEVSWSTGPNKNHPELEGEYFLQMTLSNIFFPEGTYVNYADVNNSNLQTGGYSDVFTLVFSSASAGLSQTADIQLADSGGTWTVGFNFSPGPVPEPTSAMLLLLGVTGLMLKRKCA